MDYTAHGILQARMLELVAFPFSRGSSQPWVWTQVFSIAGGFFTSWATREAQEYWSGQPISSPVDLPGPGIEPGSPALQADSLPTELSRKLQMNLPEMRETWVRSLSWEDSLKECLATHSSIPAWRSLMNSSTWRATVHVRKESVVAEQLSTAHGDSSNSTQKWDSIQFSSVQSLSRVQLFLTPWIAARQASLSITNSRSSPKLRSIESVMPSSHLILCHPLSCPQSLPASESFPMSQLFAWGGQSTGVSALPAFLPKNTQDWSP